MPNHVINELIFQNVDATKQGEIIAACCCADGHVDFSILVPAPLNMWNGNVGSEHAKAFGRTGLDWNRQNWGTKWNAYSHKEMERTPDTLTLRFETAWSPPYPWLAAVLNKFGLAFEHNWLDEGAQRGRQGAFSIDEKWGPEWKEADAGDALHRHMHKLHFGVEDFADDEA